MENYNATAKDHDGQSSGFSILGSFIVELLLDALLREFISLCMMAIEAIPDLRRVLEMVRLTRIRVIVLFFFIAANIYYVGSLSSSADKHISNPSAADHQPDRPGHFLFAPPEASSYRDPDATDTFASYKWRNDSDCQISSLDLHYPFHPLCENRTSFLEAFTSGGRIGKDAPFIPRGCDMRWFTTAEVCEILGRFEKIIVVGDSMMRHVVGALNVLLREDLGYGAVTDWNFRQEEREDCFCNQQFNVKACSVQGIFKTLDVEEHDPTSLACGLGKVNVIIEMMLKYPLVPEEVSRFKALLSPTKPSKPYAFIFGHGLWNDLDCLATINWLTEIMNHATSIAPYLGDQDIIFPRLMITPNAAGPLKSDEYILSQGDKALQWFEESIRDMVAERWPTKISPDDGSTVMMGVETMGTWNMSIQSTKFDGVHLDLKGNLIKAMAVVNWLAGIPVHQW